MGRKALDLTGQKFGRLTALESTNKKSGTSFIWKCVCDCGQIVYVRLDHLKSGDTKSCGCLQKERITKHGMSDTLIYNIWVGIIQRCENPNNPRYKDYGGRGIKVCERWRNSFEAFYEDMGECPKGMSIDRWPDNDGDYELENCRWASRHEQRVNSRPNSCGPCKQRWFRAWHKDGVAQYISNNQHEFARKYELDCRSISGCLHGHQKTHKGWQFQKIDSRLSF